MSRSIILSVFLGVSTLAACGRNPGDESPAMSPIRQAAVNDLYICAATSSSLTLRWTSPHGAAAYDLRYSPTSIGTDADFDAAAQATGEPSPSAAGTLETTTVGGLLPSTMYYFVLRAIDAAGNAGPLSDCAPGLTDPLDMTPPAAIADLAVISTTFSSATLQWTAPGDDWDAGTATSYDLRYSTSGPILTDADFAAAIAFGGTPPPAQAGAVETVSIPFLDPSTTYCFAIRTWDDASNSSTLSNSPSGTTPPPPDVTPPATITDLAAIATTRTSATLQWSAPGNDGSVGTAASYDLRYSASGPIMMDADFTAATPVSGEPVPSPAGTVESMTIEGLTPGTDYYFALKASDEVHNTSALSNSAAGSTPWGPIVSTAAEVEPNDAAASATPLPPGPAGTGALSAPGDVDYWAFPAAAGQIVSVELYGTRIDQSAWDAANSIPVLRIVNVDGVTELLRHDRSLWIDGSHDLDVPMFLIPATGTYYLVVSASGSVGGRYAVLVKDVSTALQFESEPAGASGANDSLASAESIMPGTIYGWHVDGESDYFSFKASAPSIVSFEVFANRNGVYRNGTYFNPRLRLYGPSNQTLKIVNNTLLHDAAFSYVVATPGDYDIRIMNDTRSTGSGPYFLKFSLTPVGTAAESEPNGAPAGADPISYGDFVNATATAWDVDFYSFTGAAGDMVRVTAFDSANRQDASAAVGVAILGSDGATVLPSDGPTGAANMLRAILRESGKHYVRVTGGPTGTAYAIAIERFKSAGFESASNDDIASAGLLDSGWRAAGVIDSFGDADCRQVPAEAGELVVISIYAKAAPVPPGSDGDRERSGHGSTLPPVLTVYDAEGVAIASASFAGLFVTSEGVTNPLPTFELAFVSSAAGTYFVEVASQDGSASATHTYVIERR